MPVVPRYELAHGLSTCFAFLANTGEGRGVPHRAPRFLGWRRLRFSPYLAGSAAGGGLGGDDDGAPLAARLCDSLQDFAIWLCVRDDTEVPRARHEGDSTFLQLEGPGRTRSEEHPRSIFRGRPEG